jgi:hypothetical protein
MSAQQANVQRRRVFKKMRTLFKGAERHYEKAMHQSVLTLQAEVVTRTPVGVGDGPTGHARANINSEVTRQPNSITGRVKSASDHIAALEKGSRPHFPPVDALVSWVRLVLGVPEKQVRSVAFLVARAISRRGTKAHGMFETGWKKSKNRVHRYFQVAARTAREEFKRKK